MPYNRRLSIVFAVGVACLPAAARAQTAVAIDAGVIPPAAPELSVTAAMAGAVIPEPAGRVNARLLDRELTARIASLNHCRLDTARRKQVPPVHLKVDTLTLRWTAAGKGQVAAMDVIGSTPLDPGVLDCVTRDTNGWLFTAPAGGDLRLNRALVFRRWSPAAARP
jgi:hypothetical protein